MTLATAPPSTDQRIVLAGRTWEQFKLIQKGFEDSPGVRLAYFDGTIEILIPGREHEVFKGIIALLMGVFFEEKDIEFEPTGAMTQEQEGVVSAQADESYCIGTSKPTPDLSIEVVFTSGGRAKLQRYQALGVPEVWFWQDGVSTLYRLRQAGYELIERSEISQLATLDLELLGRCVLMGETSRLEAIREFRKAISKG
ncbi:Uma2 family endonuclease [Pseudanabaena sp. FACHB-2040]|uniref:Uma2 family endonuclease n=1 Tax=Pseudanabaena sp. FACHB-2040 TaxID=2692859 RepID=UPI00168874F4|nr:Uma2 family endonuclease [Pseudanabaena sp. FACHB-2040]MBD2260235.1 Uma2 family endonuclease [Pseudanabaena sp. FACHB-2040]